MNYDHSRSLSTAPTRGTLSPARKRRSVPGSSECGRVAQCSPVSVPLCPCPAVSSPLTSAPCLGFVLSSLQSSGPGSSSCCVPAAGPRRGVWPGTTLAVVWRRPRHWKASLMLRPSLYPASSVWLEEAEQVGHWLETRQGRVNISSHYMLTSLHPCFVLLTIVVGGVFLSA